MVCWTFLLLGIKNDSVWNITSIFQFSIEYSDWIGQMIWFPLIAYQAQHCCCGVLSTTWILSKHDCHIMSMCRSRSRSRSMSMNKSRSKKKSWKRISRQEQEQEQWQNQGQEQEQDEELEHAKNGNHKKTIALTEFFFFFV